MIKRWFAGFMGLVERWVAKLDNKIGNVQAWWVRADRNSRLLALFVGFIFVVALVEAVKGLMG